MYANMIIRHDYFFLAHILKNNGIKIICFIYRAHTIYNIFELLLLLEKFLYLLFFLNPKKNILPILIFMSAFNAQETLSNTLDSILKQTFAQWETWIIDDDSTDNTWEILTQYHQKDNRIKIWKNQQNQGLTKSLNLLWDKFYVYQTKNSTKNNIKYIARFDADDIMYPEKLQIQIDFLDKNPQISLLGAYAHCENLERQAFYQTLPIDTKSIKVHLLSANPIIHSNAVIRVTDWQQHIQYYDESYKLGQDFEAWGRMVQKGLAIYNLPQTLIHYTDLPTRITTKKSDTLTESFYRIRKKNLKYFFGIQATDDMLDLYHALMTIYKDKISVSFLEEMESFVLLILDKNKENIAFNQNMGNMATLKITFDEHLLFDFFAKRIEKYLAGQTKLGYDFGVFFRKSIFSPYKNFTFWQKIKFWTKIMIRL